MKSLLSSVHALSHIRLFVTSWTATCQASLSITNSQSLLKVTPSSRWCHPTVSSCHPLLSCLQSFPASGSFQMSQFFASGGWSIGSFTFSISPSNEYSGMISFTIHWLGLLAVQGTQESSPTPPFKSINSSALSYLYSPTLRCIHAYWKTHSFD